MLRDNEALMALKKEMLKDKPKFKGVFFPTAKGFGFIKGEDSSAFINAEMAEGLMPNDVIEAYVEETERGLQATSVEGIVEYGQNRLTARISVVDGVGVFGQCIMPNFVSSIRLSDDQDGVKHGDIVLIEVDRQSGKKPTAKVIKNYGDGFRLSTYRDLVMDENGLCKESIAVDEDIISALSRVTDLQGYEDMTDIPFVTVDGKGAKDLDDAVYVESIGDDAYCIYLAIADPTRIAEIDPTVTSKVIEQGCSSYLLGNKVNMFESALSESVFSLLEGRPRSALVMKFIVNKKGYAFEQFSKAIICSRAQLSYEDCAFAVTSGVEGSFDYSESLLSWMGASALLEAHLNPNNYVDFFDPDYDFEVDGEDVVGIFESEQLVSHAMVKNVAVAANVLFAKWAQYQGLSGSVLFSVHEGFRDGVEDQVLDYLKSLGIECDEISDLFALSKRVLSGHYHALPNNACDYSIKRCENNLKGMLRFYKKGRLSTKVGPHKPMGLDGGYATWTSAIRKASDFLNHQAIKAVLSGQKPKQLPDEVAEKIGGSLQGARVAERTLSHKAVMSYLRKVKSEHGGVFCEIDKVLDKAIILKIKGVPCSKKLDLRDIRFSPHYGKSKPYVCLDSAKGLVVIQNRTSKEEIMTLKLGDVVKVGIKYVDMYEGVVLSLQL